VPLCAAVVSTARTARSELLGCVRHARTEWDLLANPALISLQALVTRAHAQSALYTFLRAQAIVSVLPKASCAPFRNNQHTTTCCLQQTAHPLHPFAWLTINSPRVRCHAHRCGGLTSRDAEGVGHLWRRGWCSPKGEKYAPAPCICDVDIHTPLPSRSVDLITPVRCDERSM